MNTWIWVSIYFIGWPIVWIIADIMGKLSDHDEDKLGLGFVAGFIWPLLLLMGILFFIGVLIDKVGTALVKLIKRSNK